jgi:hypothetical protein
MTCPQTQRKVEDVLSWFYERSYRYLRPEELAAIEAGRANIEANRADTEAGRADLLAAKLRELGIDPDML